MMPALKTSTCGYGPRLKAGATEKATPGLAPSASAASAGWQAVRASLPRREADLAAGRQRLSPAPRPTAAWREVRTFAREAFRQQGEPEPPLARGPKAPFGSPPSGSRSEVEAVRPDNSSVLVHSHSRAEAACRPQDDQIGR